MVDGLPQTTPEKQDKLVGILRKLYDSIGTMREGVHSPRAPDMIVCPASHHLFHSLNATPLSRARSTGGLVLPQDPETNMTRGFAFIEFSNPNVGR